jgi:hypothetical protein
MEPARSWRKSRAEAIAGERVRVLIVTTRSRDRLQHILQTAARQTSNPHRSLFYGIHRGDYLAETDAVCKPCFRDHRGLRMALVPGRFETPISPAPQRQAMAGGAVT